MRSPRVTGVTGVNIMKIVIEFCLNFSSFLANRFWRWPVEETSERTNAENLHYLPQSRTHWNDLRYFLTFSLKTSPSKSPTSIFFAGKSTLEKTQNSRLLSPFTEWISFSSLWWALLVFTLVSFQPIMELSVYIMRSDLCLRSFLIGHMSCCQVKPYKYKLFHLNHTVKNTQEPKIGVFCCCFVCSTITYIKHGFWEICGSVIGNFLET